MKRPQILILGRQDDRELPAALTDLGFSLVVRGSVFHCLQKLKDGRMSAVIVARDFTHADVLEFLLNVRDINDAIPLIIMGQRQDSNLERTLAAQKGTAFVNLSPKAQQQRNALRRALADVLPTAQPDAMLG